MFSIFLRLKPEKQERTINAAIKEFAQKGYRNASTDEIVKDANISKGALYKYFHNKKNLFLFIYDHSSKILTNDFYGKINLNEKDIFQRLWQRALHKIKIVNKYPDIFDFIMAANIEEADVVKNELEHRSKELMSNRYDRWLKGIDVSRFKEGIDIERTINVIIWTMESLSNREREKLKSLTLNQRYYDEILAELEHYLELLKMSFYK